MTLSKLTPYYDRNGITLYLGDCREILPQITEKVDLVIADYPFKHTVELAPICADRAYDLLVSGGNLLVVDNPHNMFKTSYVYKNFIFRNEFAARNNNRACDTIDVLAITAKNCTGKLLPYKELINVGT